jgi:aminomethyltransferase
MSDDVLTPSDAATDDRPEPSAVPGFEPTKRAPAHRRHAEAGARFVTEGGWEVPADYGDGAEEAEALERSVAVADVSARAKVDLRGDVRPLTARLLGDDGPPAGDLRRVGPDHARGLLATIGDRWALLLGQPGSDQSHLAKLEGEASASVMVTDVASLWAGFAVAGPLAFDLLSRITGFDLQLLPPGSCAATRVLEVGGLLIHRDLPTTVVEVYVGAEYGKFGWEALLDAGHGLEARPAGWDALRARGWW